MFSILMNGENEEDTPTQGVRSTKYTLSRIKMQGT